MAEQEPKSTLGPRILQEYLSALADSGDVSVHKRHHNLLFSFAELRFKLGGGGRCSLCRAAVRHVVPVTCERTDGRADSYECLCTRCLEGEKASSRRVSLQIGDALVEYTSPSKLNAGSQPAPVKTRAAGE